VLECRKQLLTLTSCAGLTVAQRRVVPLSSRAGADGERGEACSRAGILLEFKVENDYQSFDLEGFEGLRDIRKRKETLRRCGDDSSLVQAAFWYSPP
jgi:hypothetical protein